MAEITPFINLQTDFGFKVAYGSEKHKQVLIRFLNALFKDDLTVNDIRFHDKEILPSEQEGKRIIFDVYCTTRIKRGDSPFFPPYQTKDDKGKKGQDHHFIVEMQNIYTPPFEERMVYYASKMVSGQGKAGWNYFLDPVFAVAVTDFDMSRLSKSLVKDMMIIDRETHETLTEKFHIFFCSLKQVPDKWEDCRTEMEEVLFLTKNMEQMDMTSPAYKEGRYPEFFEAARSNNLTQHEVVAYSQSLEKLRETQAGYRYAADRAREEGLEKGREEGREEGILSIVRIMRAKGLDDMTICNLTGITSSDLKRLLDQD